jgi:hypothetical protein
MQTIRIIKTDQEMLNIAHVNKTWGRKSKAFKSWNQDDKLLFIVDGLIDAFASVDGPPFTSHESLWEDHIYSHRIPIRLLHRFPKEKRFPIQDEIEPILKIVWGENFFRYVLNQKAILD